MLDAAARRLNAQGVSEEWFGDIAADLGLTRPALYSHFDDRDELLFACYMRTIDALEIAFAEVASTASDEAALFDGFLSSTINEAFPELAVVAEVDILPAARRNLVRERWTALVGHIAAAAVRGARAGRLRPIDPHVVAQTALALAQWAPLQRRLLPDRPTASVLVGAREVFLRGVAQNRAGAISRSAVVRRPQPQPIDLFDRTVVAAAKLERLLGLASSLFNRRGVGATRVEEVAEAVGVNKRAIFRQFGSKDRLVGACFERANKILVEIVEEASALPHSRLDALHHAVRQVALRLGASESPPLTSHVGLGRLTPNLQDEMRSRFVFLEHAYRGLLSTGTAQGSIRDLPVGEVTLALAGMLNWVASVDLSGSDKSLDLIATNIADIATNGLLS